MVKLVVEAGEVERPSRLPTVELLRRREVLEVLVVCPDLHLMFRTFQEVSPLLERTDNGEHFLVVDHVVAFNRRERFGEERDGVLFLIDRRDLGQDGTGSKVRAVSLDAEGFSRVRRDKNRGRGDAVLEAVEG